MHLRISLSRLSYLCVFVLNLKLINRDRASLRAPGAILPSLIFTYINNICGRSLSMRYHGLNYIKKQSDVDRMYRILNFIQVITFLYINNLII